MIDRELKIKGGKLYAFLVDLIRAAFDKDIMILGTNDEEENKIRDNRNGKRVLQGDQKCNKCRRRNHRRILDYGWFKTRLLPKPYVVQALHSRHGRNTKANTGSRNQGGENKVLFCSL